MKKASAMPPHSRKTALIGWILALSFLLIPSCLGEESPPQKQAIRLYLSDITHAGGYWRHGCSDQLIDVTVYEEQTAINEKTFFYTITPCNAGSTIIWFEFYPSGSTCPQFYMEYAIQINDALEMTIRQAELVTNMEWPGIELTGTWVIYDGGAVAPEVLQFHEGGTGIAFHLADDYEEVWLDGQAPDERWFMDPDPFRWTLDMQSEYQGMLCLGFESHLRHEGMLEYPIYFEANMDGTALPGFALSQGIGGGGWVKVPDASQGDAPAASLAISSPQ